MKKTYLIKYALLLLFVLSAFTTFAQTSSISGKVVDEANQPLPGAVVTIKETQQSTATDVNGSYLLKGVTNGAVTLQVRFVGYTVQEKSVAVSGNVAVNFKLLANTQGLNEVVVIGYGTQRKKDLTGAISVVSSKDFQQGQISSPQDLIAGKIAGVTITSNGGAPGGGSVVRIRAGASLNATNDPLYIIDGVPIQNATISGIADPLSTINPNDIESFTVLKDASATAIYGSRASNGVILITTKRGIAGTPQINFNTSVSAGKVAREVNVLSAAQIRAYVANYDAANGSNKAALLGKASTNWQNEIYQTAITSDNNLSISGATKHLPYRVSVGYLDQTGILKTDQLKRTTASISLSPKLLNDNLKIDFNIKGTAEDVRFANTNAINAAIQFDPTQAIKAVGSPWNGYYEWYNTPNDPTSNLNANAPRNPVGMLLDNHNTATAYRSLGNLQLDYKFPFLPELHANLNVAYDIGKGSGSTFVPANAAQSYTTKGANNPYKGDYKNKVGEFYLNYNKDLKVIKSNINVTAGYGYYDNTNTSYSYRSYTAAKDTIAGTKPPTFPSTKNENTLISYYGRLIYTFDTKYILSASIRTDGSSRFITANRWSVFPAASLTWRVSDEDFLKDSKTLSDLKLRLSYGITGQQEGIDNYASQAVYSLGQATGLYQFGDTFYNTYTPAAYNSALKWEQTKATNFGVDYGFLNNRITGSIDVYYKTTSNLLSTVKIPTGSNFSTTLLTNVGNMENRGIEFGINAIPVKTKNISWNVGFNATYQTSKITNLTPVKIPGFIGVLVDASYIEGSLGQYAQINAIGNAPNSFYLQKQVYDANGKPIEGVYQSTNGSSPDQIINHSPAPKYIFGFSTQFTYQKWTLSTVLRANLGNYIYNNISASLGVKNNIITPVNNINNAITSIYSTDFVSHEYASDYYVQNASFLKMDNVGLAYNAGHIINNHITLRVNANCQNVFTVTNYTGIDPEIYSGLDKKFYPRPRTYTLGLNLGF